MSYITDHKQKFEDLRFQIANQDQLRRKANGGNSILFTYPPVEETEYIEKAKEIFSSDACFIDISKLFVEFIDEEGWDSFKSYYEDLSSTPHLVFHSDDPATDLFDMIIKQIVDASKADQVPLLIRTGCLHWTGIENVNIMEHPDIMRLAHPLVIFYPSKVSEDNLLFLNCKPASNYRCVLVK